MFERYTKTNLCLPAHSHASHLLYQAPFIVSVRAAVIRCIILGSLLHNLLTQHLVCPSLHIKTSNGLGQRHNLLHSIPWNI